MAFFSSRPLRSLASSSAVVWCVLASATLLAAERSELILTPTQRQWVADHPVIRIASDPQWAPFSEAIGNGRIEGIDVDLVRLIEERLHVRFSRVPVRNWTDALARAGARDIDILSGTARVPAREDRFVFTTSYLTQSMGIVTRLDETQITTLATFAGHRVAVVRNHSVTHLLQRDFPTWQFVFFDSVEQALRAIGRREADAVVTNLVNASYLMKQRGFMNLKIAGLAPYRFELRLAVRRDWPELVAILDAAIASISSSETQRVLDSWIQIESGRMVQWEKVIRFVACGALLVGVGMAAFLWHNRRLRHELGERQRVERELREAHGKLARLNEEKNRIINMAAHDLRNPLTGVLLSVQVMNSAPPAERHRRLGDITVLCHRMLRLVTNLLDAQLLEDGQRMLRLESTDLAEVVRECARENRAAAERKQIALRMENVSAPILVLADRGALRQIIDNLLSNALKFSPIGGHVWVGVQLQISTIRCLVRDDGPGIAAPDLSRLFTKYTQLGHRPTGGESSIGLGLAIVRQLAEAMHGRVWCESQLGHGATFVLELPVAGSPRLGSGDVRHTAVAVSSPMRVANPTLRE